MKAYKLNYVMKKLDEKGLTHSKPKIIELTRRGIIPQGSVEVIGTEGRDWRFYTDEDIEKVIELLEAYGDKRKKQDTENE